MRIHILSLVCLVLAFFILVMPAFAQEATPEPVAPDSTVIVEDGGTVIMQPEDDGIDTPQLTSILLTVVILALLATFAVVHKPAVEWAAKNVPSFVVDAAFAGGRAVVDAAEGYAEGTVEYTYDDVIVAELRKRLEAAEAEIRALRGAMTDGGANRIPGATPRT